MFPDVDLGHFIMRFIALEQLLCVCNLSFSFFLDVEKSIKMKQIILKPNQAFVFVFPESPSIEMCNMGTEPKCFLNKILNRLVGDVGHLEN